MIGVLLTTASTRAELEKEYAAWLGEFRKPPMAILGHKELSFAFPEQQNSEKTYFNHIPILDLDDFLLLHAAALDPDFEEDAEEEEEDEA